MSNTQSNESTHDGSSTTSANPNAAIRAAGFNMASKAVLTTVSVLGAAAITIASHRTGDVNISLSVISGLAIGSNAMSAIHSGLKFSRLTKAPEKTEDRTEEQTEYTESNPMTHSNIDDLPSYINP